MWDYLQSLMRLPRAVHFYLLSEMLFGLGVGMAVILNFHYLELGFDTKVIGFAAACHSVTIALCSYPAGMITDRYGSKLAMLIGSVIVVVGYTVVAFVSTPESLYLAQILLGVGVAFVISCEFPYIMSLCERKEDETVAYNMLIAAFTLTMSLGNILGTKLPPYMPEGSTMYQSTVLLVALSFFLMFVLRIFLPAKSKRLEAEESAQPPRKASWKIAPSRQVLIYVLYATVAGMMFNMINPFENVILRERFALSDDWVGYLIAVNSFLIFLVTLFTPLLMQSRLSRTVLYASFGVLLAVLLGMGLHVSAYLFSIFLLGKGMSNVLINAYIDSQMMKATPNEERGVHSGLRNLSRSLFGSGAASLAGYLLTRDMHTVYFIAIGIVMLQVAVYHFLVRPHLMRDLNETF